jgi:hypothetical protein
MRRYSPWLLALIWLAAPAAGALELPQTGLAYEIEVSFDPAEQTLDGVETIRWTNPSATATVDRVPLHLYLNAFANDQSTWMRTTLGRMVDSEELSRKFDNPWGYNEPRTIRQDGTELVWAPIAPDDGNPLDRSLIEVVLAEPVGPGETLTLEIEFDARLPVPFARTGGFEDFFLVAQWFPKLAMYETVGVRGATADRWNAHQFHGRTEFYAEYADFDVRIGLPPGWAVAATGQGGVESEEDDRVWHRYRQRAVHDFAFATGSGMVDVVTTHQPAGDGGPVEIHVFLPAYSEAQAPRWRRAAEGSLDVLGARVGPYPYATLTVVMPPFRQTETWGMEYPTLFTGLAGDPLWDVPLIAGMRMNEQVIAHEFCHEYFYGLIGTNEFEEAFLETPTATTPTSCSAASSPSRAWNASARRVATRRSRRCRHGRRISPAVTGSAHSSTTARRSRCARWRVCSVVRPWTVCSPPTSSAGRSAIPTWRTSSPQFAIR